VIFLQTAKRKDDFSMESPAIQVFYPDDNAHCYGCERLKRARIAHRLPRRQSQHCARRKRDVVFVSSFCGACDESDEVGIGCD
jgi:predicted Fe-S protein YdhL (DUF1289 family)